MSLFSKIAHSVESTVKSTVQHVESAAKSAVKTVETTAQNVVQKDVLPALQKAESSLAGIDAKNAQNPNTLAKIVDRFTPTPVKNLESKLLDGAAQGILNSSFGKDLIKTLDSKLTPSNYTPDPNSVDGEIIGGNDAILAPGTPFDKAPGVLPDNGKDATGKVLYINGAWTNQNAAENDMQFLANRTQSEVVCIHNATQGIGEDMRQVVNDNTGATNDPAVKSATQMIMGQLQSNQPMHIVGYSQGASITAAALRQVQSQLSATGMTPAQVQQKMSLLTVDTFGGVGTNYPDGPTYTHHINQSDLAPFVAGLSSPNPLLHPGFNAKFDVFNDDRGSPVANHDLGNYLDHLQNFAAIKG